MYQDTISSFSLPPLNDRFEMLRQLGNVFIVQPEILKTYLTESYLARIENRLLRPFVMQRTDWGDHGKKFWNDIFGDEGEQPGTGVGGRLGGYLEGLGNGGDRKDDRLPSLPTGTMGMGA
jgi:hypothetical protein